MSTENIFDTLQARGYIAQTTNEELIRERLARPGVTFYIGFDPTADSLRRTLCHDDGHGTHARRTSSDRIVGRRHRHGGRPVSAPTCAGF